MALTPRVCDNASPMSYERENITRLSPYVPGEQPDDGRTIKLNTNENPYPPVPAVMDAIAELPGEMLRRYPSPTAARFREVTANVHGVASDQIIATNGGDELLRLAVTVFAEPDGSRKRGGVGMASPSYSLYPTLAAIHDTPVTAVPLNDEFAIPGDFAARLNDAGCRVAFVVNPHAPSGRLQPVDQLRAIAETFRGVLVIDEAYVDFAPHDALPLVRDGLDNVLLLRSLSKGYALAGLRFGYGIGHAGLIAAMDKARDSYNTDALSQAAACAALTSREAAGQTWRKVIAERDRMTRDLRQRGFAVPDSASNFVLATVPQGRPTARERYQSLKQRGILVRYFDQDRLRDKLRISIGTPEQNAALLDAIDQDR